MDRAALRYAGLVVLTYGLTVPSAADRLATDNKPGPPSTMHREVPDDPYLPTPPQPPRSQRGKTRWVRGLYVSIQVNVDEFGDNIVGDAANEPSIAIDPTDPSKIVIGWRQFDTVESNFRQAGWGYSHDGGQTWTFPGVLEPGVFGSDPVLDSDSTGNFYYNSLKVVDSSVTTQLFKSLDGGVSWWDPVPAYGGDKEWMTIDRTGGIGDGNIYSVPSGARSTDGGVTFSHMGGYPGGFWGTVTVGPDGAVYTAEKVDSHGPPWDDPTSLVTKSTNAQDPDAVPVFDQWSDVFLGGAFRFGAPNPGGLLGQPWIACDHSDGPYHGNVYVLCSVGPPKDWGNLDDPRDDYNDPLDVMFARSTDGGLTWSWPVRVNDDPRNNGAWQWFGTMSVAPNGRIDAIWNDTRNDPAGYDSELYHAYSIDAGQTWSANQAVSPPFDPHVGWPQQHKIGDYYHAISDNQAVNVAYAATFNGEHDVYFLRIASPDCNRNGVPDGEDLASGTSDDCNENGIPDECEDCNDNGVADACDIAGGTSQDENGNGVPDECELRLFVDADAPAGGDGLTWPTAFSNPQPALAAAAAAGSGGTVVDMRVAEGIYRPAGPDGDRTASFQLLNRVVISGGYAGFGAPDPDERDIAAYETILSGDLNGDDGPDFENNGENSYHVVTGRWNDASAMLNGVTITAGNADGGPFDETSHGGGMYNRNGNATLLNCTFTKNRAAWGGGGMYNREGSSPKLTNCAFTANSVSPTRGSGGGMHNLDSSPTLTNCTFIGNSAVGGGGGMFSYNSSPTLTNCAFNANSALRSGGGMASLDSSPTLTNCAFNANSANGVGGGMVLSSFGYDAIQRNPTLTNCTFSENSAAGSGGGMSIGLMMSPTLANCIFTGNRSEESGGAIHNNDSTSLFTNCTFVANSAPDGQALGCDSTEQEHPSTVEMTNCILWDGGSEIWNNDGSTITITYSDVHGGWPGEGNIDVDPLFVDADGPDDVPGTEDDNLRLSPGSPCINTGDPGFVPEPGATDLDGYPRVLCGRVDMGAHEFGIGDYDCSQWVDLTDFAAWAACMTGPRGGPYDSGCEAFDFDYNGDVDTWDFGGFQRAWMGFGP